MHHWLLHESVETQPYLLPEDFADAPRPPDEPLIGSEYISGRLKAAGLSVYVVDHSRSDTLLRTVRSIVPGLRHIWNRRAPGRLYDVPVKLGWLKTGRLETELNPLRCMI
jgi:ribosomal protein S12 methylthiotransferase accessory factor